MLRLRWRTLVLATSLGLLLMSCGGEARDVDRTTSVTDLTTEAEGPEEPQPDITTTVPPEEAPSDEAPEELAATAGSCTITITGDRDEVITYPQSFYSLTSDHWTSEDELRQLLELFESEESLEDIVARGEPAFTFFALNCVDPDEPGDGVVVTHTNATTRDQLPMGAANYPVSGGLFDADGPAATVIAAFSIGEELYGTVEGSGALAITRWDLEKVEGRLTFDAVEIFAEGTPLEITVTVEFSFSCTAQFSGC